MTSTHMIKDNSYKNNCKMSTARSPNIAWDRLNNRYMK